MPNEFEKLVGDLLRDRELELKRRRRLLVNWLRGKLELSSEPPPASSAPSPSEPDENSAKNEWAARRPSNVSGGSDFA